MANDSDSDKTLIVDTLTFMKELNNSKFSGKREEMLDHWLHEFIMCFVPETASEKTIYASSCMLLGKSSELQQGYLEFVSPNVVRFLELEEERNAIHKLQRESAHP